MKYVLIIGLIILVIAVIGVLVAGWVYLNITGAVNGPKQTSDMTPYRLDSTLDFTPELLSQYQLLTGTSSQELKIENLSNQYGTYSEMRYVSGLNAVEISFWKDSVPTKVLVDSQGSVLDVLESERRTFPVENYYLSPKGFYTLEENKFSDYTLYTDISESITDSGQLEELHADSTYYISYSFSSYTTGDREYEERLSSHIFFHEGVWKKASVSKDLKEAAIMRSDTAPNTLEWKIPEDAIEKLDTLYGTRKDLYNPALPLVSGFDIELDYFEKETYTPAGRVSIGSTTGYARPASWSGTGYYTISRGEDKLLSKVEDDIMHEQSSANDKQLHSKEGLNIALLTVRGPVVAGQAEETIYVIK